MFDRLYLDGTFARSLRRVGCEENPHRLSRNKIFYVPGTVLLYYLKNCVYRTVCIVCLCIPEIAHFVMKSTANTLSFPKKDYPTIVLPFLLLRIFKKDKKTIPTETLKLKKRIQTR